MKKEFSVIGLFAGLSAIVLTAWQLLAQSEPVSEGVHQSLLVCGNVLIPSLFPFMVLAAFLPASRFGSAASLPARGLGRLLYGAPPQLAPALLMSWVGGYPAGAGAVARLVDDRQLTPAQAERALCYCVNSGPAFLVTVVGAGLLGSTGLGLGLFACQLVAGMITARLLGRMPAGQLSSASRSDYPPTASLLVSSVHSAAMAMINICAFVLLMGGGIAMLEASGALGRLSGSLSALSGGLIAPSAARVLLSGSLEICCGCAGAASLTPSEVMSVLPFLLSFGGVSVICQVACSVEGRHIRLGRFVLSRLVHGLFTQLLATLTLTPFLKTAATFSGASAPLYADSKTILGTVLLLILCALLCLTLEKSPQQNG